MLSVDEQRILVALFIGLWYAIICAAIKAWRTW